MKKIFLGLFFALAAVPQAHAAPTQEETEAFFAQQRKDKTDFEQAILAETDSRTAATQVFNKQAQADRITFQNGIPDRPTTADLQRFDDFNESQRQKRVDFQKSFATLPLSKFEQVIADFDKKALADRNALNDSLAEADPETRAEALRQFQNDRVQKRAQLKNDTLNSVAVRRRQFQQDEAQEVQDFFGS